MINLAGQGAAALPLVIFVTFTALAQEPGGAPGEALRSRLPGWALRDPFLLENWQWLGLLALLLLWLAAWRLVAWVTLRVAARRLRARPGSLDERLLRRALDAFGLLLLGAVLHAGFDSLGFPPGVLGVLHFVTKFIIALAAVWLFYRVVDFVTDAMEKRAIGADDRFDALVIPFVRTILRVIVLAVGLALAAENFDVKVSALVAGLGIGGIAIALAAQDTLGNFFGSLAIIAERPFSRGDAIKMGDTEGTVEKVGWRSTRIRTPADSVVTIPNSTLSKALVDNLGARQYRRWRALLALSYDTPPDKVEAFCDGIRQLVTGREFLRQDSYHVYLHEFGPSSLQVLLIVFFEAPDYAAELRARHELALDIMRLAARQQVKFAAPA